MNDNTPASQSSGAGSPIVNNAPPRRGPTALRRLTGHNCVICMDPIYNIEVRAPCSDYYCKDCILELFESATRDESLFPPRCCRQNIPLESVRPHMTADLVKLFEAKTTEFGTLKRVYCANSTCSHFLGEQIESAFWHWFKPTFKCAAQGCGTSTCTRCKSKVVDTKHICKLDDQHREVLALGRTEGWTRCPGCEQMIELNHGCYHMTCRCKTQFCYVCRATWKTCTCPQWHEDRLLAAAEARADAELGHHAPVVRPPPRPAVVQARPPLQPAEPPALPAPRQARRVRRTAPAHTPLRPAVGQESNPGAIPQAVRPTAQVNDGHARLATPPVPQRAPGLQLPNNTVIDAEVIRFTTTVAPVGQGGRVASGPSQTQTSTQSRSTGIADSRRQRPNIENAAADLNLRPQVGPSRSVSGQQEPVQDALRSPSTAVQSKSSTAQSMGRLPPARSSTILSVASSSKNTSTSTPDPRLRKEKEFPEVQNASTVAQRRETLIREWVERLRVDHDCQHDNWKYRRGGGRCVTCQDDLPFYSFRCNGCQMLACRRCTKNRL